MAADAILNFAKNGILGHSNPCMADIYQCTKFDENIFIYERDKAIDRTFKMAAAAMLNCAISGTFGYCDPCIANIYQCTKFD